MQEDKEEEQAEDWDGYGDVDVKPFNWTLAVLVIIIIAALTTTLIILQQNQTDTTSNNDALLVTESIDAGAEPQGQATSQVTINILPADNAGEETE